MSLCPNCNERMTSVVKEIKKTTSPNTNQWNEEQDKTERNWSCLSCGLNAYQVTFHKNKRKKRNNGNKYRTS